MTNVGSTVVVTIGRNKGNVAMTSTEWRMFSSDVEMTLVGLGCSILLCPKYQTDGPFGSSGIWDDNREDAAAFVALVPNEHALRHLTIELDGVRRKHGQDAIGFIVAPGHDNVLNGV